MDLFLCMQNFIDIVDYGGLTPASEIIGTPPSALSKRLQSLEDNLGSTLIHRTTRRFELSEAGERFYRHAKKILLEVGVAKADMQQIDEEEPNGIIRFVSPANLDIYVVQTVIGDFMKQYPKITLQLYTANSPSMVVKGRADVSIAVQKSMDKQLTRHAVFKSYRGIFATPDYLEEHGHPETMAELVEHNCLTSRALSPDGHWHFSRGRSVEVKTNYIAASGRQVIHAGLKGLGLFLSTRLFVQQYIESGQLVELDLDVDYAPIEFYLYCKRDMTDENARLFVNFFREYEKQQR